MKIGLRPDKQQNALIGVLRVNRREMLKLSLATGAVTMLPEIIIACPTGSLRHPTGACIEPKSPAIVNEFKAEMPLMEIKLPVPLRELRNKEYGGVLPNGTVYPQVTGADALTTYPNTLERVVAAHQRNSGSMIQFRPQLHYVLDVRRCEHRFHTDAPYGKGTTMWGYDGKFPGPTFISRHGVPILVRIINSLFDDPMANPTSNDPKTVDPRTIFGDTQISTHLHNGHTGSESDGNPFDIYPPEDPKPHPPYPASIQAIRFRDHHYPMFGRA